MKIYRIVLGTDVNRLEAKVDSALANGWKCQGGIFVSANFMFYQAMTRKK